MCIAQSVHNFFFLVNLVPSFLILHEGFNDKFTCEGPKGTIVWIVNGMLLENDSKSLKRTANLKILQIQHATLSLNETTVQCRITINEYYPEYRTNLTSDTATLLVQGDSSKILMAHWYLIRHTLVT